MPFLFVSATSFQSMYYGATAKKIRAYFKALRKAARTEGGAIGFIEEIDAIAIRRGGMASAAVASSPFDAFRVPHVVTNAVVSEGTGGVVNELLVQMQSFDQPTGVATSSSTGSSRASTCCCPPPVSSSSASPSRRRSCSSPPPTAPTPSTRRCCGPAASTAG